MLDSATSEVSTLEDPTALPLLGRVRLVDMQRRPTVAKAPAAPRPARRLHAPQHLAAIEAALAELRPRLNADGGDCQLVGVEGDVVRVRMTGACVGCQLASMTVMGVRMRLIEKLGFPVKVIPV